MRRAISIFCYIYSFKYNQVRIRWGPCLECLLPNIYSVYNYKEKKIFIYWFTSSNMFDISIKGHLVNKCILLNLNEGMYA